MSTVHRFRAHRDAHVQPQIQDQARRSRLFGRAGHLDHPQVAANRIRRRGHHLHRRPRPGRGAGARAQEGGIARRQARAHLHRGPARGIRPRLRVPDVPRQRAVRGTISARHVDRAPPDRQAAGRDRAQSRGGRDRPWRDRQGQRSGALRALGLRARARHQDHRAVARMELRLAHRAPRPSPSSTRSRSPRTSGARRRSRPTPTSCTSHPRARCSRTRRKRRPITSIRAPSIPNPRPTSRPSSRSRSRKAIRSRSTASR